ncbi:translation elongation factor 4 [Oenococcus alcoholitolerans]|uniref:translation elongation factor 4 n=1 Tax=Oenococcus alcoholitolerans TaxID=931074 RepID=UPI003F6FCA08
MSTYEQQLERQKHIRNFSIVAHIDHGKSTIADRILEMTHTVAERQMKQQILDDMPLERERGITIKMNSVEVHYDAKDGQRYIFHLIDTPGHVDFSYEVSRALAAADGALLVVDASQGVQAQTLANVYLALDNDLEIVPVINKIDLPSADVSGTKSEIEDDIGIDCSDALEVSAKTGLGIDSLLEAIVKRIPAPKGDLKAPLAALVFDSKYDSYRGVVLSIRVKQGVVHLGDKIRLMNSKSDYEVTELGVFSPDAQRKDELIAGDVGYLTASIKDIHNARSGDTITSAEDPVKKPLKGYRPMKPMVYAGIYPTDNGKYDDLRDALEKLSLNDASLEFEPETSTALGFGFRVGFLGLLHMDVIQERLEREFDLKLIVTAPTVTYRILMSDDSYQDISNPSEIPDANLIKSFEEPIVNANIMTPEEYVGPVMELAQSKRGEFVTMEYLERNRVNIKYKIPLSEIIFDFFDRLKSSTKGYASLDYDFQGYQAADLKRIDILLNGDKIDALSFIAHKDFAENRARVVTGKLKQTIPRQNFEIAIQAAIGAKIISRTNIKAYRKDVTARIHTGDPDRRAKLLNKQKAGKARMKAVGKVEIPQEAFMSILKNGDDEQYNKGIS